ncbi:nucleotidyl transferase family protein [Pararcticibacter amylolyticus]|uniref:Sugar-binding protein n=1 Tax=Pararcticibacter amylolyticus TaxID=2173175 RepID=A0A2U2P9D4_9SPHI|nr:hypothetical protein [Pararcticibacter amylolyticus]PWG77983.1 hypothetical protein DDR33_24610 [Pararcticibacter amylolyticus]
MKMKLLPNLTALLICLFLSFSTLAQIPLAPANIQSPNAASLGMYGQIPISYFTGLPRIEIPLHTISQRDLSVPISLSYHASGMRPDMHPGWVGTGWSLNSGGVISRIVKDVPDDYHNPNYGPESTNSGFYYNRNVLNTSDWNQISYMQSVARDMQKMLKDTEPDEFSFNFGDYSGNFYLSPDGTWKVQCDRPLQVSLNGPFINVPFTAPLGTNMSNNGMSQTFGGFTITTEDGTKYYFGGNSNAIEYSIDFFAQAEDEWKAGSWYLTKIVSPKGEEISFNYERDDYLNQMYISIVNDLGTRTKNSGGIFNPQPACNSWSYSQVYHSYNGKLIAPVYLKQINGVHSTVKFNRSTSTELRYDQTVYDYKYSLWSQYGGGSTVFLPILSDNGPSSYYPALLNKLQWKKLDQIRVEKSDGTLIKAFNLDYSNNVSQRLTLLSLTEQGSDLNAKAPYSFAYDQSVSLPGYLSNMVDHWGFYNGTYANITNQNNYYNTYYSYRNPVAAFLYAGTLNRITYPTGGVTEFTYEPHSYGKQLREARALSPETLSSSMLAGGLRIKKIVSYDPQSPLARKEKRYFYVSDFTSADKVNTSLSSGILGGQIKYYFFDYSRRAFNDNGVTYSKSLFSSQSVLPGCINAMGCHVGYSEVVELSNEGSYNKYTFSNFDSNQDDQADNVLQLSRTIYEPYSSTEQERGKLIKEQNYNASGKKVRERNIGYIKLNKETEFVPSLKANFTSVCSGTAVSVEEGTAYKLYTYAYLPDYERINEYDTVGTLALTVYKQYTYSLTNRLVSTETVADSRGNTLKKQYVRPYDLSSSIYNQMTSAHVLSPVIEERKYRSGNQIGAEFTDYALVNNSMFLPVKFSTQTVSDAPVVEKSRVTYDDRGNVNCLYRNGTSLATTYLWSYGGQYPIAKIDNAEPATVYSILGSNVTGFRNNLNPTSAQVAAFLAPLNNNTSMKNAQISSYTFDPYIGVTSITDVKGMLTGYDYDNFQRLRGVKDFNGNILKGLTYYFRPQ